MSDGSNLLKKVFSQSMIYWAGTMLSKMIGFLLIPFYTRYLTPDDYGVLELLLITVDVISLFVGLQLVHAVARYHESEEEQKQKNAVISTAIFLTLAVTITIFGVLIYQADEISRIVFSTTDHKHLFQVIFIAALFGINSQIPLLYIRIKDNAKMFVVITVAQLLIMVLVTIYFVAFRGMGVMGVVIGTTASLTTIGVVMIIYTLNGVGLKISKRLTGELVRYSAPLIPGVLGMFILNYSDRYFLNKFSTLEQVGLYALGYKFGFLMNSLLLGPFNLVWGAKMFEVYNSDRRRDILNKVLAYFALLLMGSVLVMSLFIEEILVLMTTPKYYAAAGVVPIIALAYAFNGLSRVMSTPLYAEKRTKILGAINFSSAILCLGLNYLLIPVYGMYGAAWATLTAFIINVSMETYASTRVAAGIWKFNRVGLLIVATLITGSLGYFMQFDQIWISLIYKTIIVLAYIPLLYFLGFFEEEELVAIKKYARRIV